MRRFAILPLALVLAACPKSTAGTGTDAGTGTGTGTDAGTGTGTDAGTRDAKAGGSNLLYTTNAVVAVSSKVDNPKDFPEHLVDGKPETAWNGKTGQLVGGWIQFRIPAAAHVRVLMMSAGFDKKAQNGDDLFTMNHRISKVKISRNGALLREVPLDPNRREPQLVPIDTDGGDFRIDVLAVVPGTKKEWRELTVSELAVWGEPREAALVETHLPHVFVGSLEGTVDASAPSLRSSHAKTAAAAHPLEVVGVYPTLDEFCKRHVAAITPKLKALADHYPGPIDPPYCEIEDKPLIEKPDAPVKEVRAVKVTDVDERYTYVAIVTEKGATVTRAFLDTSDFRNPGCGGNCSYKQKWVREEVTKKGTFVTVLVDGHCWTTPIGALYGLGDVSGGSTYKESAAICFVDAAGTVSCKQYDAIKETETSYMAFEDDFDRVQWALRRRYVVTPDGDIVYE